MECHEESTLGSTLKKLVICYEEALSSTSNKGFLGVTLSTHHKWQVETKNYSFHNESQSLETLLINCKTISWKFIYLFIFIFFGPTRLPLTPQN